MTQHISAPAKIILFGEHAVVYGRPAIAIPISTLRARASFSHSEQPLTIHGIDPNPIIVSARPDHPLALAAILTLKNLQKPPRTGIIHVYSDIPVASGLGSGAAVSAVIARAACALADEVMSLEQLNSIVYEVEKVYHHTPSGIDNTTIVYEKPIYFVRESPIQTISSGYDFTLVVADTGIQSPTHVAVDDVAMLIKKKPALYNEILDNIGEIVRHAKLAIQDGDVEKLGSLMDRNQAFLQELTVSSPQLEVLITAAREAGAIGAKLSGGGRGGNMIALVSNNDVVEIQQALLEAGANQVYSTVLKRSGS